MNTKETNDIQSALVSFADTIAQYRNTSGTLTVEAKVIEVIDDGLGIYKVEYLENTFEATAANTEITYEENDLVYVLIPNGDFDKNKIIISPVSNGKSVYADTQNENLYIALGSNLFSNAAELELYSNRNTPLTEVPNLDLTDFYDIVSPVLEDSRTLDLTCYIKTDIIQEQRKRGNYGLVLTIPVIQEGTKTNYTVTLDINNLKGDLYNFSVYTPQHCYFTIPDTMELDPEEVPTLESFVSDFVLQDAEAPADIWIKAIQLISCLEQTKDNMNGYHVVLTASGGSTFYGIYLESNKTLIPTVYFNGKVTDLKNFDCYWFKENASVGTSSDKYNRLGGIGWEILNEKTNTTIEGGGTESFQYIVNNYEYEIEVSSFLTNTNYKCVLVKGGMSIEDTITIRITDSPVELSIFSNRADNTFIENLGDVKITMRYIEKRRNDDDFIISYVWKRYDRFGNYINDSALTYPMLPERVGEDEEGNHIYEGSITFSVADIISRNTIVCSAMNAYERDGKNIEKLVGTKSIIVSTVPSSNFTINVVNGDKLYKYDADGDSPMVADYDGPLSSALKEITPISFRLFKQDGSEFNSSEYAVTKITWLVPINSMINLNRALRGDTTSNPGYYTIEGSYESLSSLSYSILDVFDKNKTDNTIIIKAEFKGNSAENVAHIRFLKDGESGTNGSKYSAVITYNDTAYEEKDINGIENKLQLFYVYDKDTWFSYNPAVDMLLPITSTSTVIAEMGINLYADGLQLDDVEVEWSIFDNDYRYINVVSPVRIDRNGQLFLTDNVSWVDDSFNFFAIVQAKITAKKDEIDESITNSEEYIYAYYPIETVYVEKYEYLNTLIPEIKGGFSQVVYASDGTNPQYDSSNPFYIENDRDDVELGFLYDYQWSGSKNLRTKTDEDDSRYCKVSPATKFDNGVSKNYIKVAVVPKSEAYIARLTRINNLDREIQEKQNKLTYYLLLQQASSILKEFDYDNYVTFINDLKEFFAIKANLLRTEQDMLDTLKDIQSFIRDRADEDQTMLDAAAQVLAKQGQVEELIDNTYKLGGDASVISVIQASIPAHYILTPISSTERTIYTSVNNMMSNYNQKVNVIYNNYQSQIDSAFVEKATEMEEFLSDTLIPFVNDERWETLTRQYPSN